MPLIMNVIAMLATEVVTSTFGIVIYYVLFRVIVSSRPRRPKELRAKEHIYYPVRFYFPAKTLIFDYIMFIFVIVSYRLWLMDFWENGKIIAAVCLVLGMIVSLVPQGKTAKRVVVNAEGLTLEKNSGGQTQYSPSQYDGCDSKCVYFLNSNRTRKRVSLSFLCRGDRYAVANDLSILKQTGKLNPSADTKEQEERRKANQAFLEEKQKLYADTKRYEEYLKEESAQRLGTAQKQDLVRMIKAGDKMNAIKSCREWSGLGLKEAKDVVERYRICLLEREEAIREEAIREDAIKEEPVASPSAISTPENITDRLKTDAEIREMDKKYSEEVNKWQELYADPTRYDAFLRQAGRQVSENRRREIVQLAQRGNMVPAIKLFRDTTGYSLKVSHDLVMAYQTYLTEDEQREEIPAKEKNFSWKWRISDKEQDFSEQTSLEGTMDKFLSDLSMKREEVVALIPPAPLMGIACVRARLDPHGIMYRVEVEYVEHDAQGNPKILYKDGLMTWDVRDVFVAFRRSAKVQTEGWQQLKAK